MAMSDASILFRTPTKILIMHEQLILIFLKIDCNSISILYVIYFKDLLNIMNAIYLCVIAEPWIRVSQELKKKLNITPSYFVCWGSDLSLFEKSMFDDSYIQTIVDAWRGTGFPSELKRSIFDESELRDISSYELIALKMMDRLDPDGESFPFNTRLYFFRDLLGYWLSVIKDRNIDLVISPSIPHRVFDYALYVVCKIRKIKFIMFQMTPFGSGSLIIDDVESVPNIDYSSFIGKNPTNDIVNKIDTVKKSYVDAIPDYMKMHAANDKINLMHVVKSIPKSSYIFIFIKPSTYWVKKGFLPNEKEYTSLQFQKMQIVRQRKINACENFYKSIVTNEIFDNFILVALHYQPEETSCPTGGSYADQILIIQLLDDILPRDIKILVKEHKSQFYTHQEGASGRDLVFYRRINDISSRVNFISEDAEPFSLIDKAKAVVTISGTIGWESAIRGTPVLIFGRAWYESMPRIFKVKTKEDILTALDKIREYKNKDFNKEILAFHAALEDKLTKAKHYKAFLENSDVSMEESITNIVKGIALNLRVNHSE